MRATSCAKTPSFFDSPLHSRTALMTSAAIRAAASGARRKEMPGNLQREALILRLVSFGNG